MSCAFCHGCGVVEVQPPVKGRCTDRDPPRDITVIGDHGCHKAALAAICQCDGMVEIPVRHDGRDWAKRLHLMHCFCAIRVRTVKQHGGQKCPSFRCTIEVEIVRIADHALCLFIDQSRLIQNIGFLPCRDQGAHSRSGVLGIAECRFRETGS